MVPEAAQEEAKAAGESARRKSSILKIVRNVDEREVQ